MVSVPQRIALSLRNVQAVDISSKQQERLVRNGDCMKNAEINRPRTWSGKQLSGDWLERFPPNVNLFVQMGIP
jgi:hypothetical protein